MGLYTNLKAALTPDSTDNKNEPSTADQDTLKILIGLLGISLPFILWGGLFLYDHHPSKPLESISHYYYTRMSSAFVVTVSLLAIILIFYKGKTRYDAWLSSIAGVFAFFVVLLPTTNLATKCNDENYLYAVTYITDTANNAIRSKFHFISAGIFLSCLAAISFFRFPKTDTSPEFVKHSRLYKFIYKACGIIMVIALVAVLLGNNDILLRRYWFEKPFFGTFLGEAIAVCAFGYSWLLNAGFFTRFIQFVFASPKT